MVELVADGAREKALRGERLLLAVAVEIGELYLHGTGNHAALAAHRKATLPAALLALLRGDFRIDKLEKSLFDVHDDDAAENAVGSEAEKAPADSDSVETEETSSEINEAEVSEPSEADKKDE